MALATATGGASTPFDKAFSAASRACSAFEAWQRGVPELQEEGGR